MSATSLKDFQFAVDEFDALVRSLPDTAGAKEMQERMQQIPGKLVSVMCHPIFAK
jgi:hypothetical protein